MVLRRLFPTVAFLLLVFGALRAPAQVGVYGEFSAEKMTFPYAPWIYGPTIGGYWDKGHFGFLATGLDVRVAFLGSGQTVLDSGLVGPRLVVRPHVVPIQPYVEALIGAGHADFGEGFSQTSITKFQYQFLGGVDLTVLPRLDWRVAEFSFGELSGLGESLNPKTISTGVVLRLP